MALLENMLAREFLAASGIEKKIVREENGIEKNENGSEDNGVEHSKV